MSLSLSNQKDQMSQVIVFSVALWKQMLEFEEARQENYWCFWALLLEKIPEDIVNNQENKGKRRGWPAVTWMDSVIVVMSAPLEKLKNQVRDTSSGRKSIYVIDKNQQWLDAMSSSSLSSSYQYCCYLIANEVQQLKCWDQGRLNWSSF